MHKNSNKKNVIIIVIAIVAIVAILIACVSFGGGKSKSDVATNKAISVVDSVTFKDYAGEESFVLKVKNTSSKTFVNVTPVLIYYDNNNMPIHEGWGSKVSYFAPNDTRYIEFYDTIKDYSRVEVGFFDREDKSEYTDLRDKISYTVEKAEEPDEDGMLRLTFNGENKSDKEVVAEFQVGYYSKGKLIYEDSFIEIIDANSTFDTYEEYATKYNDGKDFPKGYTYEVVLAEVVENILPSPEEESGPEEEDGLSTIYMDSLNNEEKIEHAVHRLLKNTYGEKIEGAKIYVDKIYTKEEIEKDEALKSLKVGEDDLAFEISIHLQPAEGTEINELTAADGVYDKDSGWVKDIHRLGILRYDDSNGYSIDNYGTGW